MTKPALTAYRVMQSLYDAWVIFDGLHVDVAYEIADRNIDRVIATLRRDPRFAAVSVTELELILADVRRESAVEIATHTARHAARATSAIWLSAVSRSTRWRARNERRHPDQRQHLSRAAAASFPIRQVVRHHHDQGDD
jgi:hypothetical protein